tara:strand:+ start:160 stop:792 length:633 start_codon:yes stop_codon:yes gene_type:complete
LANRLSTKIKKEILDFFINSQFSINELSNKFECTNATITRNLKKELGNEKYKEIIESRKLIKNSRTLKKKKNSDEAPKKVEALSLEESDFNFVELAPLDYEIDNFSRKELSSVPIQEIKFPNIVYMIVHKNIELEIKLLKDYPDWEFLPTKDLKRKTIEIYLDLKKAKRVCTKEQKVIKVPNTDVFRIVAPILRSRGISRIISDEQLIAL